MYIANAGTSRYIKVRMNICTGGTAKCKYLQGIFAPVATSRRRRPRPPPPSTPPCTSGSLPSGRCSPVGGFRWEKRRRNLPIIVIKDICSHFEIRTHPSLSQASLLGLSEVIAVGCGGGLNDRGLLEFKIIDSTFRNFLDFFYRNFSFQKSQLTCWTSSAFSWWGMLSCVLGFWGWLWSDLRRWVLLNRLCPPSRLITQPGAYMAALCCYETVWTGAVGRDGGRSEASKLSRNMRLSQLTPFLKLKLNDKHRLKWVI